MLQFNVSWIFLFTHYNADYTLYCLPDLIFSFGVAFFATNARSKKFFIICNDMDCKNVKKNLVLQKVRHAVSFYNF